MLWKSLLNKFKEIFPLWAPRVAKWRPSGPFGVEIWLNDGNHFLFSKKGRRMILRVMENGIQKGMVIYDSTEDGRKGL